MQHNSNSRLCGHKTAVLPLVHTNVPTNGICLLHLWSAERIQHVNVNMVGTYLKLSFPKADLIQKLKSRVIITLGNDSFHYFRLVMRLVASNDTYVVLYFRRDSIIFH